MAENRSKSEEQPNDESSSSPADAQRGEKDAGPSDEKVGWIDNLARRSTGLPQYEKAAGKSESEPSAWRYAGLGIQFAGTTGLFVLMGYELDKRMGWAPWGMVSLGMLGLIGGLYLLIKDVIKADEGSGSRVQSSEGTADRKNKQQ